MAVIPVARAWTLSLDSGARAFHGSSLSCLCLLTMNSLKINSCTLDVKQPAGILFSEALQMCWISLLFYGCESLFQWPEAAAIIRPENHVFFTHGIDQK